MILVSAESAAAKDAVEKLALAMTPEAIDPVVDKAALITLRDVVEHTPKKWFGQVRAGWQIQTPGPGARIIENENKVMLFLEEGTSAHGPTFKKSLYIPLTRRAAAGWHQGLKYGVDYILRKSVKGIEARRIARDAQDRANTTLLELMKEHISEAIQ
jgi:hypothetical protein